jgi:hypothetical protein
MSNHETDINNYEIRLVESKQENISSLKINQLYLHSRYNPIEEANKIANSSYKKNHLHILFGFGLGYIAHAILKKLSDTDQLLIIEPNLELFNISIEKQINRVFLNNEKVQICTGLDFSNIEYQLNSYFKAYLGRFTIILSPNYTKLYPVFYKNFLEKTKEYLMMEIINNNTRHIFSKQWQENYISNLYKAHTAHNIEDIKAKLNCPAVIVSGGPSLTKQLQKLKNIKNKAIIICAGSTINSLIKANILPDLIVTVDGGEANFNHFKNIGIEINNIPLIYPLIVHKDIPLRHEGQHIVFNISDHSNINKWTEKILSRKFGVVQTGHSVANFCLDIAHHITNGPVCIIGQDLAYTNNQSHELGNQGFSLIDKNKEKQRKMFYAEGYYGDKVLTDYVFHGMKQGFEQHLLKMRGNGFDQKIYNATEGGLKIDGFKQITFTEFIESYCIKDYSKEISQLIPPKRKCAIKEWKLFKFEIIKLINQYEEVLDVAEHSLKILVKVKKRDFKFSRAINEEIGVYDEKLKILLKNEFIDYLLKPTIFKVQHSYLEKEDESEEETSRRIYFKSLLLYDGIKNAAKQGLSWLQELEKRIEKHL